MPIAYLLWYNDTAEYYLLLWECPRILLNAILGVDKQMAGDNKWLFCYLSTISQSCSSCIVFLSTISCAHVSCSASVSTRMWSMVTCVTAHWGGLGQTVIQILTIAHTALA